MRRWGRGVGQILALIIMLSALEEQGSGLFFWGGGVFNYLRMILLQKELLQLIFFFLADNAH